jgi:endonuclease YncB( thermonuclease family)
MAPSAYGLTMNQKQSRWLVIGFLGTLMITCLALTYGVAPYLRRAAASTQGVVLHRCMEVASADILRVRFDDTEEWIRLVGVTAPTGEQGRVSRNTLSAWIYRRSLLLVHPFTEPVRDDEGRLRVYAEVAGVDVSKKLLQGGQVYASDEAHPKCEEYKLLESIAREARIGIWR